MDSKRILARISGRNEHQSLPREWRPSLCKTCTVYWRVTGLSPSSTDPYLSRMAPPTRFRITPFAERPLAGATYRTAPPSPPS